MDIANEIINADTNVGPSYFDYSGKQGKLLVRSLFNTIQGEAPFAGHPATFLRLGGCNRGQKVDIGCAGCDTEFKIENSNWMDSTHLVLEVALHLMKEARHPRLLVITGGEPMLQLHGLIAFLSKLGRFVQTRLDEAVWPIRIQFETNGDFDPFSRPDANLFDEVVEAYEDELHISYVISPKSPYGKNRWWMREKLWDKYMDNSKVFIRRVVSGEAGSHYYSIPPEIMEIIEVAPQQVYLSPQTFYKSAGAKEEDSRDHIDWERTDRAIARAIELASHYGCRVSFQAHSYANIR